MAGKGLTDLFGVSTMNYCTVCQNNHYCALRRETLVRIMKVSEQKLLAPLHNHFDHIELSLQTKHLAGFIEEEQGLAEWFSLKWYQGQDELTGKYTMLCAVHSDKERFLLSLIIIILSNI